MSEQATDRPDDLPRDSGTPSRAETVAWIIASVLLVAVLTGVWLRIDHQRGAGNIAASLASGDRPVAPDLPVRQIDDDGAPGLPSWYAGGGAAGDDLLLVNFWASWCGPCEEEAPDLQRIADEVDGVTVVGVNAGAEDLERDARAFVQRHELTFPIVRGTRSTKEAWGVRGYPETFLVGRDGRISSHINGPIDEQLLREVVQAEVERAGAAS